MQNLQPDNILGGDFSNHQGVVDMSSFKVQGIQFLFFKSSQGATFKDAYFATNVSKANAIGIPCGGYHYADPFKNTPQAEAKNFLDAIAGKKLQLCPVLDCETGSELSTEDYVNWVKAYRAIVEPATGKKLILYTGKWFADIENGFNNALADMPLWYASYNTNMNVELPDFGGWANWILWQYSETGTLAGVQTKVDMDYARSLEAITQPLYNYNVYQRQNGTNVLLKQIDKYDDAVAYAKQFAFSSIIKISNNDWVWDNYAESNLPVSMTKLVNAGISNSPDYWLANAKYDLDCRGDYMGNVFMKFTKTWTVAMAIDKLVQMKILDSAQYWKDNCVVGKTVKGHYCAIVLNRMAMAIV